MRIIYSDEPMPYGKYEGVLVSEIINTDPDYVTGHGVKRTVMQTRDNICFSEEAIHKARSRIFTLKQPNT